jgi:hypothetical protein
MEDSMTCSTKFSALLLPAVFVLISCSKNVNYTAPEGSMDTAITHYSYRTIVINNHVFHTDVVILPDGSVRNWPVGNDTSDLAPRHFMGLIRDGVTRVVIGRGFHSQAELTAQTKDFFLQIEAGGIPIHVLSTTDAVNLFNQSSKQGLLAFVRVGD